MRAGRPSLTARWVAVQRARLAHTRPSTPSGDVRGEHALVRDVSGVFALPLGRPTRLAERTAFIDNEVASALGRGVTQVVILGAGYDGRPLRFGGGATRWFEVDFPSTQADKRRRLARLGVGTEQIAFVPIDLLTGDLGSALDAAGHDRSAPSLFIGEGLLSYLTLEASADLLRTLRGGAAPGSVLVTTFLETDGPRGAGQAIRAAWTGLLRLIGEPKRTEFLPGDPEKLLVVTGWNIVRTHDTPASRFDPTAHSLVLAGVPAPGE
ncbi:MAG TPA: SAM-dependent methyltransferase [Acidimicrobiales bacterium]|nr:SAM-dependent methyltransferase [Acidimicrobiales bacterium]